MKKGFLLLLSIIFCLSLVACGSGEVAQSGAAPAVEIQLAEGEEKYIENETYEGDVIISGDNAQVVFVNCTFRGDVINTAELGTRVMLLENSVVNGVCIIRNNTKEATMEVSFPKFIADASIDVVCQDCFGTVAVTGDFEFSFNGQTYALADSELFSSEEGFVPYEGQEASAHGVCQWWENGEQTYLVFCE